MFSSDQLNSGMWVLTGGGWGMQILQPGSWWREEGKKNLPFLLLFQRASWGCPASTTQLGHFLYSQFMGLLWIREMFVGWLGQRATEWTQFPEETMLWTSKLWTSLGTASVWNWGNCGFMALGYLHPPPHNILIRHWLSSMEMHIGAEGSNVLHGSEHEAETSGWVADEVRDPDV